METASFGQGRRMEAPDPVSACGAWGVPLGTARTASRLSARGTTPACVSPADRTETLDGAQEPALVDPKSELQQAAEEGPPPSQRAPSPHLLPCLPAPRSWDTAAENLEPHPASPPSSPGLGDSAVPGGGDPHLACVCCFSPPRGDCDQRPARPGRGTVLSAGKENVIASLKLCIHWKPSPGVRMK